MPIDPFKPVTYSAARRRFERATGLSVYTLTARESEFHSGAKYALVNEGRSTPLKHGVVTKAC